MTVSHAQYKKSSFGPAFLFLDKNRRAALAAYYAFCRLMDDIADEPGVSDRLGQLQFWRQEVERLFGGTPETDLGKDLQKTVLPYGVEKDRFLLLIDGMEADVRGQQYATQTELNKYIWQVAGIPGLATLDILGLKGSQAVELARTLGGAVQTTNIVRDIAEDASLGRVYLPQDLLVRHGIVAQDFLSSFGSAAWAGALREMADYSLTLYKQAQAMLSPLPWRQSLPCRIMGRVYRANLAKIEKRGFVSANPIKLSRWEKLRYCVYALFSNRLV